MQFFNGLIDDVRVYNRALSSSEIYEQYIRGVSGSIHLRSSNYTEITNNLILNSTDYGVRLSGYSANNDIYANHVIGLKTNFTKGADDWNFNQWDDGAKGNYWSDWLAPDNNTPLGIVDTPYPLQGLSSSTDDYPLCPYIEIPANITPYEENFYMGSFYFYGGYKPSSIWSFETDADWLTVNPDGTISGTPDNWDVGQCYVNASISDLCCTKYKNVTLTVKNVNDPPAITTTDVTAAVEDVGYSVSYSATDIDLTGDTMTWAVTTNSGFLQMGPANGTLYGTPTNSDVGTYWVNVTVSDGHGGQDWSYFPLTVANVNDAPMISVADVRTATEDVQYLVNYTAIDIDPTGDVLVWAVATNASFLSIGSNTGKLQGMPGNDDVGIYWVNVSISDGHGGSDWSYFELAVINVNDVPIWDDVPSDHALDYNESFKFDVNATDVDKGAHLQYYITSTPSCGISVNRTTGKISWVANQLGNFNINISAYDGFVYIFYEFVITVSFPVKASLKAPANDSVLNVTNPLFEWIITGGEGYTVTSSIYISKDKAKVSSHDVLARKRAGISGTSYLPTEPMELNSTYYWTVTPAVGSLSGTCESGIWTFSIAPGAKTNHLPVFLSIPQLEAGVGKAWSYSPVVTDADEDDITLALRDGPVGMTIGSGIFSWTPTASQLGSNAINISASDGKGEVYQAFSVLVTMEGPSNRAPTATPISDRTITEGDMLSVQVQAADADGDHLTYTKISGPNLAAVSSGGLVTWQTKDDDAGSYLFLIRVSDNKTSTDVTFRVTVREKSVSDDDDTTGSFWLAFVIGLVVFILLLIIIAVVLLFVLRKRQKRREVEEDSGPKTLLAEPVSDKAFVEKRYADIKKPEMRTSEIKAEAAKSEAQAPEQKAPEEEHPLLPPASVVTDVPPPPPFATQPMAAPPEASAPEPSMPPETQAPPMDFAKPPEAEAPEASMDQFRASLAGSPQQIYQPESEKVWSPEMVEKRTANEAQSAIQMLKELNELKAAGAITQEEFEVSKRRLLRKI